MRRQKPHYAYRRYEVGDAAETVIWKSGLKLPARRPFDSHFCVRPLVAISKRSVNLVEGLETDRKHK